MLEKFGKATELWMLVLIAAVMTLCVGLIFACVLGGGISFLDFVVSATPIP